MRDSSSLVISLHAHCVFSSLGWLQLEVFLLQLLEFGGNRAIPPSLPSPLLYIDNVYLHQMADVV